MIEAILIATTALAVLALIGWWLTLSIFKDYMHETDRLNAIVMNAQNDVIRLACSENYRLKQRLAEVQKLGEELHQDLGDTGLGDGNPAYRKAMTCAEALKRWAL